MPAQITVDGTVRGTTPISVTVPVGDRVFSAVVPDHPETQTGGPVTVEEGKRYTLNLEFAAPGRDSP